MRGQAINEGEGNILLDKCKSNSMLILNAHGRCGADKNNDSMTFRNQSVIDYSFFNPVATIYKSI